MKTPAGKDPEDYKVTHVFLHQVITAPGVKGTKNALSGEKTLNNTRCPGIKFYPTAYGLRCEVNTLEVLIPWANIVNCVIE